MTPQEMLQAGEEAIGGNSASDYKIEPSKHAELLMGRAPALATVLRRSEILALAEQYEQKDQRAIKNQAAFKATANRANRAILITACFSALLVVTGVLKSVAPHIPDKAALLVLGLCGVVSGALGAMWLFRVKEGKLLNNWMSARAAAEALRTLYFEAVTSLQVPDGGSSTPLPLLQFEYFRRYQLNVQIAFYRGRAEDHARDADRMLRIGAGAVALASISTGLAALLGTFNTAWVSVAALGTIAAAISSFVSTKEAVNQSRRNAELYDKAHDALMLLKRKIDDVRAAALTGQREPISQFVSAVHEQLSLEHRQWLDAAKDIQPAIDKLEETLAKLKSKSQQAPKPASQAPSQP